MRLLIKNGRMIDPASNTDAQRDLLIEDGMIRKIGRDLKDSLARQLDAKNQWVTPGWIDLHVHFREPGFAYKETIETGSKSAAAGGFTTVCAMPNTKPAIHSKQVVEMVQEIAVRHAVVHVLAIGSMTKDQAGLETADISGMAQQGVCAVSEDGKTVTNAKLFVEAAREAARFGLPVFSHCEDPVLADGGVMHEGKQSRKLGMKGIPSAAENIIIARDALLAEYAGAKLHICHISTKEGVELLRQAKQRNVDVSGEVCPHHFSLTDEQVDGQDANFKMSPPLREKEDVEALKRALREDIIEVIATDHAPHHGDEKNCSFEKAANGIVGLETAAPLCLELVEQGVLTPLQLISKVTWNPAKILGMSIGALYEGAAADITVIDPETSYQIDVNQFYSKGRNSPYHGRWVKGRAVATIVSGVVAFESEANNR